MNETQLEAALRSAPKPEPPADLKQQLLARVSAKATRPAPRRSEGFAWNQFGLRRWWPTLLPAGLSLFCVVVLAVQQSEIRTLRADMQKLGAALPASTEPPPTPQDGTGTPAVAGTQAELNLLQQRARELTAEVARLEQLQIESRRLRAELVSPPASLLPPDEMAALQQARDKAVLVKCINNMKQLGLAALVCAENNNGPFPQDVMSMSAQIRSPLILVCPADAARQPAQGWESFSMANCSYEWFLTPQASRPSELEHDRVLTRCPVHGAVGLYDGSVHSGETIADRLVTRDGKVYLRSSAEGTTNDTLPR